MVLRNTISRAVVGLLFLVAGNAFAQRVDAYTATGFSGSWNSIYGNGGSQLVGAIDDGSTSMSMPFAFTYDGTTNAAGSTLYIGGNGAVGWSSMYCCNYNDEVGASNCSNTVCTFADDLYTTTGIY